MDRVGFPHASARFRAVHEGHVTYLKPGEEPQASFPIKDQAITVRHLMTHTSGLTYGFMQENPVDARYRELKIEHPSDAAHLAEWVERLATIPLICQPGSQWNYSVSTDVLVDA